MDFDRLPEEKKVFLAKRYFMIGCACAPLVWMVNAIFFFNYAFCKQQAPSPAQKTVRKYVIYSIIGSILWGIIFILWQVIFRTERAKGLTWTEALTFVYPSGYV